MTTAPHVCGQATKVSVFVCRNLSPNCPVVIGIRTSVVLPADIYCFAIGHFDPGKVALAVIAGYNSRVIRNDFDDCSMRL